mgnify:CR=1 FL=1
MSADGSGSSLSASRFLNEAKTRIKSVDLAMTLLGGLLTVWGIGIAAVVDAVFQIPISIYQGIGGFIGGGISGLITGLGSLVSAGWISAATAIAGITSVWAPAVSILVVLVFLFLIFGGYE